MKIDTKPPPLPCLGVFEWWSVTALKSGSSYPNVGKSLVLRRLWSWHPPKTRGVLVSVLTAWRRSRGFGGVSQRVPKLLLRLSHLIVASHHFAATPFRSFGVAHLSSDGFFLSLVRCINIEVPTPRGVSSPASLLLCLEGIIPYLEGKAGRK